VSAQPLRRGILRAQPLRWRAPDGGHKGRVRGSASLLLSELGMPTRRLLATLPIVVGLAACTPTATPSAASTESLLPEAVTHDSYHQLLARYVSEDGRVAYEEWSHHPKDVAALDAYLHELSDTSPLNFPDLFPSSSSRLSYWINLYNALVIREVLERWPLATVEDVRIDNPRFDVPGRGLLHDLSFTIGGRRMTLLEIEHEIIRDRFGDARTHFAITCSARSCPMLPRNPFDPRTLDDQLDDATRRFVNDEANVRVEPDEHRIVLSPIFRWYRPDFIRFVEDQTSHPAPDLVDFLLLFAEPRLQKQLERAVASGWAVRFEPYDWSVGGPVANVDEQEETPPEQSELAVGEPMPRLRFRLLDGSDWDVHEVAGKVVLIDFWASFCRPCLASFPELEALQEELGRDRFLVVAVAEDDVEEPVRAFVEATKTKLVVAHDPKHLVAGPPLSVERLPTEILVDGEGVIRYRFEGLDDPPVGRIAERARELLAAP